MSANLLHDQMIAHIEKMEFLYEVVSDWAADPGMIETMTERTITRVFAGLEKILEETADALREIAERGPEQKEVPA